MLSSSDGTFGALPWTELYRHGELVRAEQVRPHDRRVRRNRRARRGGRQGGRRDGDSQRHARGGERCEEHEWAAGESEGHFEITICCQPSVGFRAP